MECSLHAHTTVTANFNLP